MRLSLSVNGRHIRKASLAARGWLSAHITLSQEVGSDEIPDRVWMVAYDKSEEPNSVAMEWEGAPLSVGDKVEVEVLQDGDADEPTTITRSLDSPKNLFSNGEQAKLLLDAVKICDTELWNVLTRAEGIEPTDELQKIRSAVGEILVELDRQLISPTLRRHPELLSYAEEKNLR